MDMGARLQRALAASMIRDENRGHERSPRDRRSLNQARWQRARAGKRYETFVTALGRGLAKGPKRCPESADDVPGAGADPQIEVADRQTRR